MRTFLLALALMMAAPAVADARGSAPMLVVTNHAYTNTYNRDPAEVVELALNRRLYHITAREPNAIVAYYEARGVRADIRVAWTSSAYSITYVNSQGLNYTGSRIDPHYNHWVNNLDHDLQIEFGAPNPNAVGPAAAATTEPPLEGGPGRR